MYVSKKPERKFDFLISFLLVINLTTLVHYNAFSLYFINRIMQQTVVQQFYNNHLLNEILLVLSYPIVVIIIIALLVYWLWNHQHQIPASWVIVNSTMGFIILGIMWHVNRHDFFNASFCATLLLYFTLTTMVVPQIKIQLFNILVHILLVIMVAWIGIAQVQLGNTSVVGLLITYFGIMTWIHFSRNLYLKYFGELYQYNWFNTSDYN